MSKGRGRTVQLTVNVDQGARDWVPEWSDFRVRLKLVMDRRAAAVLARDLLDWLAKDADADHRSSASEYGEFRLRGLAYATGRLPRQATFREDGTPAPGIVIVDSVHGWDFPGVK